MNVPVLQSLQRETRPETILAAGAALLVIGVVAIWLHAIKPHWEQYRELTLQHSSALQLLPGGEDGEGGGAAAIAALERDLGALRDRLYGGAAVVPRRQIESFVVDSLDRLSVAHGVQLQRVTPEEPGQAWMFEELPYEVRVAGAYFALHRWLHDVEEELRPMVVKQFGLSPGRGKAKGQVILDLRLVAYRSTSEGGSS